MRELQFSDSFLFSEIIDKMNIQADLNKLFDDAKARKDSQEYLGGQLILMISKRWHLAQKEITHFIAELTEKTPEEVSKMKLSELKGLLKELFSNPEFADFFKSAVAE